MEIVTIFIIVCILGALLGANSFGEAVREGCGCLISIIIVLTAIVIYYTLKP